MARESSRCARILVLAGTLVCLLWVSSASAYDWPYVSFSYVLVDDYSGTDCDYARWYYTRIGSNRGAIGSESAVTFGNGRAVVNAGSEYSGVWSRLLHDSKEGDALDPRRILGRYIKDEYQVRITGVQAQITDGTGQLKLELKAEDNSYALQQTVDLTGGSRTVSMAVDTTAKLKEYNWVVEANGSVNMDSIGLSVSSPSYSLPQAAFLLSYAHFCQCFDHDTGLVRDRARWPAGDFDAVQTVGTFALSTAVAYRLGYVSQANASDVVTRCRNALLTLPTYRGLLPHFVRNGAIVDNTEWSSVDTTIALVGCILACQTMGINASGLENMARNIDWSDLTQGGTAPISHGYEQNGERLPNGWDVFGGESFLISLLYAASTGGSLAKITYSTAPTWDGSGFNDEIAALFFPMTGTDAWGNDWPSYRAQAFNKQQTYFQGRTYQGLGLMGLSASEVPEPWTVGEKQVYGAWGAGGQGTGSNDGSSLVGYPIVAPHYAGMVSAEHPSALDSVFGYLFSSLLFGPLTNVESLGVDSHGTVNWNSLKGSWNLGLLCLGVGRTLSGANYAPYQSLRDNAFLYQGYQALMVSAVEEAVSFEAESGSGDGQTMPRSNASRQSTIWLHAGESRSYSFDLNSALPYSLSVRYSNDNAGALETVTVYLDGSILASFQPRDTGDYGYGWNVFETADLGQFSISPGSHDLSVQVSGGDGYGVELDQFTFQTVAQ